MSWHTFSQYRAHPLTTSKETARCRWVLVGTELFNTALNEYGAKKSAGYGRVLVVTELVTIGTQCSCPGVCSFWLNLYQLMCALQYIRMEMFIPARCKRAKIHRNEHTPEKFHTQHKMLLNSVHKSAIAVKSKMLISK